MHQQQKQGIKCRRAPVPCPILTPYRHIEACCAKLVYYLARLAVCSVMGMGRSREKLPVATCWAHWQQQLLHTWTLTRSPIRYWPSSLMHRPCSSGGSSPSEPPLLPPPLLPPPSTARGLTALRRKRLAASVAVCCPGRRPGWLQGRATSIFLCAQSLATRYRTAAKTRRHFHKQNGWTQLLLRRHAGGRRHSRAAGIAHGHGTPLACWLANSLSQPQCYRRQVGMQI